MVGSSELRSGGLAAESLPSLPSMDFYADASMGSDLDVGGLLSSVLSQDLGSAASGQLQSQPLAQPDQPNAGMPKNPCNAPYSSENTCRSITPLSGPFAAVS